MLEKDRKGLVLCDIFMYLLRNLFLTLVLGKSLPQPPKSSSKGKDSKSKDFSVSVLPLSELLKFSQEFNQSTSFLSFDLYFGKDELYKKVFDPKDFLNKQQLFNLISDVPTSLLNSVKILTTKRKIIKSITEELTIENSEYDQENIVAIPSKTIVSTKEGTSQGKEKVSKSGILSDFSKLKSPEKQNDGFLNKEKEKSSEKMSLVEIVKKVIFSLIYLFFILFN
jgi:hypothetical protein